jgi:hypothetical protein
MTDYKKIEIIIHLLVNLLINLLGSANAVCLFKKHFEQRLQSSDIATVLTVSRVLECEKQCLKNSNKCSAANVIHIKGNSYNCEIIKKLPSGSLEDDLLPNPRGKFIIRQGKV